MGDNQEPLFDEPIPKDPAYPDLEKRIALRLALGNYFGPQCDLLAKKFAAFVAGLSHNQGLPGRDAVLWRAGVRPEVVRRELQ